MSWNHIFIPWMGLLYKEHQSWNQDDLKVTIFYTKEKILTLLTSFLTLMGAAEPSVSFNDITLIISISHSVGKCQALWVNVPT